MPLTVSINLDVPELQDNGVAFQNAAAWTNYWSNVQLVATFDPVTNTKYTDIVYDNTLSFVTISGNEVPTKAQFNSLLADYTALKVNYKNLLNVLKAAGLITQSI